MEKDKIKKYNIVVADCPWNFSDPLTMSSTKRGADSQYSTLSIQDIKELPVQKIVADDALLVLWVPSSLLQEGLDVMSAWGFAQKQTHVWVKTKNSPLIDIYKKIPKINKIFKNLTKLKILDKETVNASAELTSSVIKDLLQGNSSYNISSILSFGMGRLFRQTHELCLIGTRGKIYNKLKNKSQRSIHFGPVTKHSAKPEDLQDMLDIMFPDSNKIELFARRDRSGWKCLGNQSPVSLDIDIRDSLKELMSNDDFSNHYNNILINKTEHDNLLLFLRNKIKSKKYFTEYEIQQFKKILKIIK